MHDVFNVSIIQSTVTNCIVTCAYQCGENSLIVLFCILFCKFFCCSYSVLPALVKFSLLLLDSAKQFSFPLPKDSCDGVQHLLDLQVQ